MSINAFGEKFSKEKLFLARALTIESLNIIASKAFIGMSEEDGHKIINEEFKKYGDVKFWHPHKFRIGANTTKAFKDLSDESIRLSKNDVFFIDIGPVLFDHEADYGNTFVMGDFQEGIDLKQKAMDLFSFGKELFNGQHLTGEKLYEELYKKANELNVNLNSKMQGHRIGDFPHHVFYRGSIAQANESLALNAWILEIKIENKEGTFGAFFEDIL